MDNILDAPQRQSDSKLVEFAPFNRRLGAWLLDGIMLYFLSKVFEEMALPYPTGLVMFLIIAIVDIFYQPTMEGVYGATLGKKWIKLVVVDSDFKRIGFRKAFLRNIFTITTSVLFLTYELLQLLYPEQFFTGIYRKAPYGSVGTIITIAAASLFLIDLMVYLANGKKQALHDMIAGTYVVDEQSAKGEQLGFH